MKESKAYVVLQRGSEYNDNYYELTETGKANKVFTDMAAAQRYAASKCVDELRGQAATKWHTGEYNLNYYGSELGLVDFPEELKPLLRLEKHCLFVKKGLTDKEYEAILSHTTEDQIFYVEEVPLEGN